MNSSLACALSDVRQFRSDNRVVADEFFSRGEWLNALAAYQAIEGSATNSVLLLQMAECHYRLGDYEAAYFASKKAGEFHKSLSRANQLHAHAAQALGKLSEWIDFAEVNYKQSPDNTDYAIDYAYAALFGFGDALLAREVLGKCLNHPIHGERAEWLRLMSLVFDRPTDYSAHQITAELHRFANTYIKPLAVGLMSAKDKSAAPANAVRTIGFISPYFLSGSTSALIMKTLRNLHKNGHRLIFFYRGLQVDSVTAEIKELATSWVDCASMSVLQLNAVLFESKLDELYDLSGWFDLEVLKAISSKPAPKQFKWVGGQLCSTGLNCYDGFITDTTLTPPSTFSLYTEPLLSLGSFQEAYAVPAYMPKPRSRPYGNSMRKLKQGSDVLVGVCAPTYFLSNGFLENLDEFMRPFSSGAKLCFIDTAFDSLQARARIQRVLRGFPADRLEFLAPSSHEQMLQALNDLDLLIDTFPHSSGVRLLEAKYLKLPVHLFSYDRQLFCERLALTYTVS